VVFNPYQVVKDQETPYGNHKLMKLDDQTVVLTQGIIEYSQPDVYSAEIKMLLPLLLHTQAENILIIGGDLSGFIESAGQLIVGRKMVYLEKDPFLLNYQKQLVGQQPEPGKTSLRFVQSDIRHFLNETDDTFDVICLNKSESFTLADNRFYTREFYQMIRKQLKPEGIFIFSVRSSENFINSALANYLNLHRNTLLTAFKSVSIIPGDDAVFLASPERVFTTLLTDLSDNIITQKVIPQYLTIPYLSYRLSAERISTFNERLAQFDQRIINSDFNVKGYIYHYQVWGWISDPVFNRIFIFLSNWSLYIVPAILLLFVAGMFLARRRSAALSLFNLSMIGGYAVALEIIFILQYQILFGSIYTGLAIIFGLFMLGLSAGAEILDRKKDLAVNSSFNQWVLAGFALLTAFLFLPLYTAEGLGQSVIFKWGIGPVYVLLLGIITGAYFSYITGKYYQVSQKSESGITYGVDLFGGMVSSFLVSAFLVPLLEISGVLILLLLMMGFQLVLQK
jgi:spermidine synthase